MDDNQIRILFLSANPRKDKPLDLQGEYSEIDTAISETKLGEQIQLYPRWKVSNEQLLDHFLRYQPHIIHFSGHGTDGSLILDDGEGHEWQLDRATARAAFKTTAGKTRLVVLNACLSADVAQVLSEVIDCVIGMSQEMFDDTSIVFSGALYRGLSEGLSIRQSFDRARTQINLAGKVGSRTPIILTKPGMDARRMYLSDWVRSTGGSSGQPPPSELRNTPADRPSVRARIQVQLRLDADFDGFVLDHFPDVHRRFAGGMDRTQKTNLLLTLKEPAEILAALLRIPSQ